MSVYFYARDMLDLHGDEQERLLGERRGPPAAVYRDGRDQRDVAWLDRPGCRALLERVQAGDAIAVWAGGVVYTRPAELISAVEAFAAKGVTVEFVGQGLTFGPGGGEWAALRTVL